MGALLGSNVRVASDIQEREGVYAPGDNTLLGELQRYTMEHSYALATSFSNSDNQQMAEGAQVSPFCMLSFKCNLGPEVAAKYSLHLSIYWYSQAIASKKPSNPSSRA